MAIDVFDVVDPSHFDGFVPLCIENWSRDSALWNCIGAIRTSPTCHIATEKQLAAVAFI